MASITRASRSDSYDGLFVALVCVSSFILGLCLDNSEWEYDSLYVGLNFNVNNVEYFNADVTWPTTLGNYELVMALSSATTIFCMQVNFSPSVVLVLFLK